MAPGTALNDVGACPVWASAGEFIKRPLPANHTTRPTASADTIVKAFLMVVSLPSATERGRLNRPSAVNTIVDWR